MKSACIMPTYYRKEGLIRALSSFRRYTKDMCIIVVAELKDIEAQLIAAEYDACVVTISDDSRPHHAWNMGLKMHPEYDAYFLGADDLEFTDSWLYEALLTLRIDLNYSGLVGINDMRKNSIRIKRGDFQPTHYLMTKDFIIDYNGGVMAFEHYPAHYTDLESCVRARKANKFAYSERSIVYHRWREQYDDGYKKADKLTNEAKVLYNKRLAIGFPDDFEPVLKVR